MLHADLERVRRTAGPTLFVALVVLVVVAALGGRALAASMTQRVGTTAGSTCSGGGSPEGDCVFSRATQNIGLGNVLFVSRYGWNLNADAGLAGTHTTSGTAVHNVSFVINAPGGYRLTVTTDRKGTMQRTADDPACVGAVETSGVSGTSNVALSSGTLDLPDPGTIPSDGLATSVAIDQEAEATIYGISNGVDQPHSLSFTWDGAVESNSCEAVLRQGEASGATSSCSSCGYPNTIAQGIDGHVVAVFFEPLCGNGDVDPEVGEQCDESSFNGSTQSCCTSTCQLRASGTVCRNPSGICDAQEACDGLNGECPPNIFKEAGTVCRPATGGCDVAESCTGITTGCPANGFLPSGTVCRPVAGACDLQESCAGTSANCPGNGFASSATVCRASTGVCDPAEHCPGNAAACPADALSTSICRAAAGECDTAESCPGNAVDCPVDVKKATGTACNSDGQSCTTDQCDGASDACQHPLVNAGVVCRPSGGDCDVAESCDGVGSACPGDAFAPASQECRAGSGECDPAETCTGTGPTCPVDAFEPDGTSCDDGMSCTIADVCVAGVCGGDSETCGDGIVQGACGEECDDGNLDANDGCSATCLTEMGRACRPTPEVGCKAPFVAGKAQLTILDKTPDAKDQLRWKWSPGSLTPVAAFGNPRDTTAYQLCVYDQGGRIVSTHIPPGGVCGTKFCWSALGTTGFQYTNKAMTPDGSLQLLMKEGVDGKARIQLKAKGSYLGLPSLSGLTQPVRIQLANTAGTCWEAAYSAPASKLTPQQFRDKAD